MMNKDETEYRHKGKNIVDSLLKDIQKNVIELKNELHLIRASQSKILNDVDEIKTATLATVGILFAEPTEEPTEENVFSDDDNC